MKFQVYTDDGRWIGQYQVDDNRFSVDEDYYDWDWKDFFDYIVRIVKEQNEGTY